MKINCTFFLLLYCLSYKTVAARQADSVIARIVFIGDAGEMDEQQKAIIPDAAAKNLPGKTTYMYLGDNIYPHGMGLAGERDEQRGRDILRSQYEPLRATGAPVYFIPGNHDWDRMGPQGLAKIKSQWAFLEAQNDSLLKLLPPNGCPDPVAINISDSLVIIALDSEWWLFPFDKDNKGAECNCNSKTDVLYSLQELFYRNRYKVILLATHHPFQSYGTHGGYFSWKDHIFPLTVISKNLYIPLPVIGSIYPLYRKTFTHPEDTRHPLYKDMIKNIDGVFKGFPNMLHVSGHEHGLQLIDNPATGQLQVVSGGGAKRNYTIKGKNSLFGQETQGYVVADQLQGNNIKLTYYAWQEGTVKEIYNYSWQYTPYKPLEEAGYTKISGDSIQVKAHPQYEHNSWFYQFIFGKNYRKEWAAATTLPVLRISEIDGGLIPDKLGGGFQSTSLRLKNKDGKEYTLRTVEKKPDLVVPQPFQGTFVRELLDEATSAQHPYSALLVDPVATAVKVPHSKPAIGVVAPDKNLGKYQQLFDGKVTLLEEREPLGDSDNFIKTLDNLQKDNDNSYDAHNFLTARMLDVLFADWDRHGDQWRFYNSNPKGKNKYYTAIPRDRDMVLNVTQGLLPTLLKRLLLMPRVFGFNDHVKNGARYYLYKSAFLNDHPASQLSFHDWMQLADSFKSGITDNVLETALQNLPAEIYPIRHDQLLHDLKARRDDMPAAMADYYRFSNRITDIRTSNKNEFFLLEDAPEGKGIQLTIQKINKEGQLRDTIVSKCYPDSVTRELRLYTSGGDDSVLVNVKRSGIKLRVIGGKGDKAYNIVNSKKKIKLYDREEEHYYDEEHRLQKHLRNDSLHTAFTPVNLYNTALPLLTAAINPDDGLFLGAGIRYMHQRGFRKSPYTSLHQFMLSHAFSSAAFNIKYNAEWLEVFNKTDITVSANIKAPDNTQNFFGAGNETPFDRTGNFKRYYRTRFNLMTFETALRWRGIKGTSLSIGPFLQYYHFDNKENEGRFINNVPLLGTYDSAFIAQDKMHLGISAEFTLDQRNSKILPSWGTFVNIQVNGYTGLNGYSRSFFQVIPQVALYKSLNDRQTIVLANRLGGGITIGKPAFYQSLFLGGQGNLFGYRQYRFAGEHSFYNNLELRIAISDFGNYLLKGQLGVIGFYDIGRVWKNGESSGKWHNGIGAGVYLAPASLVVFRVNASWSEEGWYPNFAMGFRF